MSPKPQKIVEIDAFLEAWAAFEERFEVEWSRISLCGDGSGNYGFEVDGKHWFFSFWPFGQLVLFLRTTNKQEMLAACIEEHAPRA
jgi:hypothetical protein